MLQKTMRVSKDYIKVFILLIFIYVVSLTIVYSIPNSFVESQFATSIKVIEAEGDYLLLPFGGSYAARLDNFTDNVMLKGVLKGDNETPLDAAMNINNYARYWHGYQVFLRPLLTIVSYSTIRYFNIFIILALLCLTFNEIKQKLNVKFASSYLLSMAMIYVVIFPFSMQFTTSFATMAIGIMIIGNITNKSKAGIVFFLVGSLVNFFDLLTYPLITLGIPLIYYLLLNDKYNGKEYRSNILLTISFSISWAMGYALTWLSKWILGSLILRKNVLKQAQEQIAFRTQGNADYITSPSEAINLNFNLMFPDFTIKIAVLLIIVWIILFVIAHKSIKQVFNMAPLLLISLYPYIWFLVLANHSQMHYWFTYRIQAVTVFAVLSFMISSIDFEKIKNIRVRKD